MLAGEGRPGNLRGHGAGVQGADLHRQRRRPLPGNRGIPRSGDRGPGGDPSLGTPASCGRDALAPRWTHLVAGSGQLDGAILAPRGDDLLPMY